LIIDLDVSMMTKENDKVDHDSQDLGAAGADKVCTSSQDLGAAGADKVCTSSHSTSWGEAAAPAPSKRHLSVYEKKGMNWQ